MAISIDGCAMAILYPGYSFSLFSYSIRPFTGHYEHSTRLWTRVLGCRGYVTRE
ncbi:MAG: hypothetical protein AB1458_14875 [Bacteroidota bacterium]